MNRDLTELTALELPTVSLVYQRAGPTIEHGNRLEFLAGLGDVTIYPRNRKRAQLLLEDRLKAIDEHRRDILDALSELERRS